MKKIYAYDNYEGDKGIIVASSLDDAILIFNQEYPDRKVAETHEQYCEYGSYVYEIDLWSDKDKLYVVCEW